MVMTYDGALVMPKNYAVMSEEEMTYMEGGAGVEPIPVTMLMLSKTYCKSIAGNYVSATGMSKLRIAQEIYAHAVLTLLGTGVHIADAIKKIPFASSVSSYLIEHGSKIDLGGDEWYEVAVFKAIWYAC